MGTGLHVRRLSNCVSTYNSFRSSWHDGNIFLIFFFTTVLSHWDFSRGNFGLRCPEKPSRDRVALPNLRCMLVSVSRIHRTLTWTTRISSRGVRTHVRESSLKVDSGRKIPCRTGESNLHQGRAGPTPWQLSYIPVPLYYPVASTQRSK